MNSRVQDDRLELTDGEYVRRSRNGSPEDFRLLVERYQRPLYAYLAGRLGSALEAEEAAQESFVRASCRSKSCVNPSRSMRGCLESPEES
jgi:DNA-directed RNA polymerase specialized sigma24 family protein